MASRVLVEGKAQEAWANDEHTRSFATTGNAKPTDERPPTTPGQGTGVGERDVHPNDARETTATTT